ncbi:MAG TPA: ElyC/SanA/YdcF family protein [Syntrophales bacterium]|nr:ElyC/SanA/YdcF family protein [Syntrophales bacterium]
MFLVKKIVSPLFAPVSIVLEVFLLGLIFLLFTKKQKTGKAIIIVGVIVIALFGYGVFSDTLLVHLERQYTPLFVDKNQSGPSYEALRSVKWIVLLGGGNEPDPRFPVTSEITCESLARLAECIRIHRLIPGSKIILSGGATFQPPPEAETFARVAKIFQVDPREIVLEIKSRDTEEEAEFIRPIVGKDRFILVTSAYHMPRSMAIFRKAGLHPIPGPADFLVKESQGLHPIDFYPSAEGFMKAEYAMHEYLGLLWLKLRGAI